ncbi:13947_t:CDS:1, partial [Funneliformis geosporum]
MFYDSRGAMSTWTDTQSRTKLYMCIITENILRTFQKRFGLNSSGF